MTETTPPSRGSSQQLAEAVSRSATRESVELLSPEGNAEVAQTLQTVRIAAAMDILSGFDEERRRADEQRQGRRRGGRSRGDPPRATTASSSA